MVSRVYVEKKPGFDVEAHQLLEELHTVIADGLPSAAALRIINVYDVEGISEDLFERCIPTVFSEPQSDAASRELPVAGVTLGEAGSGRGIAACPDDAFLFAVEALPGQFDQRADSAAECVQLISQGERPAVRCAKLYVFDCALSDETQAAIKHYVINPVEARETDLALPDTLAAAYPEPPAVEVLEGFRELDDAGLSAFIAERGLAMDLADITFFQRYFRDEEQRDPTITEVKVVDTYWSDHCRHTTFGTVLDEVAIDDAVVQAAFDKYLEMRHELGRDEKPVCLMDMGTIGAKYLKAKGVLTGLDESEEINACTVKVNVDVNGVDEDWLFLFKNETHNHPTEIEPFGGAATCVGGAIRDPLSGRSYVYQAMRVTGAGDPTVPVEQTLPGKLPQRKIVTEAAAGYSSYGNQIGLATGQVSELYHPGYVAKRMEVGAVVGAAPARNVRRECPAPGDVVVLLGGRTGRDGIGGATGSSKAQSTASVEECGAEVQKGNAPVERKLQRLFRRGDACRLIKRCNDFGAGGVSVAIGELCDGIAVNLDVVPKKYDGLDGTELAIAESQERMAVALAAADVEEFLGYAREENLEATVVAQVTEEPRMRMTWRGDTIVDLSRAFLARNGAPKHQKAHVLLQGVEPIDPDDELADAIKEELGSLDDVYVSTVPLVPGSEDGETFAEAMSVLVSDLNVCSNKGLSERFDSTIGAATVLMPFGGKTQLTPAQAMVAKFPVEGETTTVSAMSWGFNPYIMEADQFRGAYLSVVESVAKLVATGISRKTMYLSFQEYFEKLRNEADRWGKPVAAVLGALMAQVDLGVGAIGGKDSMSGSFEDLDVPPTLISFAVGTGKIGDVVSPEFKGAGHRVALVSPQYEADGLLPEKSTLLAVLDSVEELIRSGAVLSASTAGFGGMAEAVFKACVGNRVGFTVSEDYYENECCELFDHAYGSFIVELADESELPHIEGATVIKLGRTTEAYELVAYDETVDLAALQERWESGIEGVFPYRSSAVLPNGGVADAAAAPGTEPCGSKPSSPTEVGFVGLSPQSSAPGIASLTSTQPVAGRFAEASQVEPISFTTVKPHIYEGALLKAKPRVIIPVFPGNNCEYDTARAFERAGAAADVFVINNLTPAAVAESTHELARRIGESQIVMIPGGFSGGDEPDGSAKFITAFFRAPEVTEAVRELLQKRDGLMLGICNGFQALVKLGLVPFGDIRPMDADCATLTYNTIGRHQSRLVRTRVASSLSPWLSECAVGDVHTVAISHGEGRFVAPQELLDKLVANGQVATQYVDENGAPSMDLSVNPNGSLLAIEGITSPDGRVFGKMGHSERSGAGLYQNVPGNLYQPIFEGGVRYFG